MSFGCELELFGGSSKWLPEKANPDDSGFDLRARAVRISTPHSNEIKPLSEGSYWLGSGHRVLVMTGVYLAMPAGLEAQIRSRSGLALKQGIAVLNAPGTIDAGYRNEIGAILVNHGDAQFEIKDGDRIAQMVFAEVAPVSLNLVESLTSSERGLGGFGSTGVK